jgi:homoserine kinase
MPERVTVRVPATSANLGPGFDCLGVALDITADVTASLTPLEAPPAHSLVAVAMRAVYDAVGTAMPAECWTTWSGELPVARGLGASAALRAAGLVGANVLLGQPLTGEELLAIGASLEGHADNIAPALLGGMQVAVRDGASWRCLQVPLPAELRVVLLIPDFEMPTNQSRRKLPQKLSRDDAIFNVSRAALLVASLTQGRWDLLDVATEDRLHQPARAELFPAFFDICTAAKEAGAHAAYLSGSGSTVAALATTDEERIARLMQQTAIARGYTGRTVITGPSLQGAVVID